MITAKHLIILTLAVSACGTSHADSENHSVASSSEPLHRVSIDSPVVLQGLPIGAPDLHGRRTVTPCGTCHGDSDPSALPETADNVQGPHRELKLKHGTLRCAACHDESRRDLLHLADNRSIALLDAMELCAQCHGPQKRDYDHGAHGGMRGYWDLTRGPRERNHCVSCHDPHAPAFGKFAPLPGPRDRFTATEASHHE